MRRWRWWWWWRILRLMRSIRCLRCITWLRWIGRCRWIPIILARIPLVWWWHRPPPWWTFRTFTSHDIYYYSTSPNDIHQSNQKYQPKKHKNQTSIKIYVEFKSRMAKKFTWSSKLLSQRHLARNLYLKIWCKNNTNLSDNNQKSMIWCTKKLDSDKDGG